MNSLAIIVAALMMKEESSFIMNIDLQSMVKMTLRVLNFL